MGLETEGDIILDQVLPTIQIKHNVFIIFHRGAGLILGNTPFNLELATHDQPAEQFTEHVTHKHPEGDDVSVSETWQMFSSSSTVARGSSLETPHSISVLGSSIGSACHVFVLDLDGWQHLVKDDEDLQFLREVLVDQSESIIQNLFRPSVRAAPVVFGT
jgi:putative lipase involved disintegration of autophagic bodies